MSHAFALVVHAQTHTLEMSHCVVIITVFRLEITLFNLCSTFLLFGRTVQLFCNFPQKNVKSICCTQGYSSQALLLSQVI